MTFDRWIGVHTGGAHYLDHLGILCEGLGILLYVTDPQTFEAAKKFYPNLQVEYIELQELSLHFLAERADVIFESGHTFAAELLPLWELMHGKKMRVIYCPHGNSDKISPKARKDISLVYGDHMKNHLHQTGESALLEQMIIIGNFRSMYERTHFTRSDAKLKNLIAHLPPKKTVFYAPTWEGRNWVKESVKVIEELGSLFNLLIRLHPFLEERFPAESYQIKCVMENFGATDLSTFPAIYPILRQTDYYLGNHSSIGYDFLTFNKPLFFLESGLGDIYDCGIVLKKDKHYGEAIASFQDTEEFSAKRLGLSAKVFGPEKSFEQIKAEIKEALSVDRASWLQRSLS